MNKKAKDKTNEGDSNLPVLTRPGPDRRFLIHHTQGTKLRFHFQKRQRLPHEKEGWAVKGTGSANANKVYPP